MIAKIITTIACVVFVCLCLQQFYQMYKYGFYGYQAIFMQEHQKNEAAYIKHLVFTTAVFISSLIVMWELWIA